MDTFSEETRHGFEKTLDWLCQWACSRSFGLGSRLPWDPQWLIESLSDSTIYMAYYTVAHLLQGGTLDGSKPGSGNISPEQLTDEVWSYILLSGPYPTESSIPKETLEKCRQEFEYFYPLDLRVSGKDLVTNHLTFFIYNHTAIFPKEHWPRAVRSNGHLLLNNEKMSKSSGNFLTVRDALDKYGADAVRFALADAGDGLEDANFLEKTADDAILKLYTEQEWIKEVLIEMEKGTYRTGPLSWNDSVFVAEMNKIVGLTDKAYTGMLYREALKCGFYDLQNARNSYRKASTGVGIGIVDSTETFENMHKDILLKFIEIQSLLMAPIAPHWSDYIWKDLMKKPSTIMNALWPLEESVDEGLISAAHYVRGISSGIRSAEDIVARKKSKRGETADVQQPKVLKLYMAKAYPIWQESVLEVLKTCWDPIKKELNGTERSLLIEKGLVKDKRVMPFVAMFKVNCFLNLKSHFQCC